MNWESERVLITGGTGSLGNALTEALLTKPVEKLIIFSRDELKQSEMAAKFASPIMRFFLGDVRDKERLRRALDGVTLVIHAAALKRVPAAEYNPSEAVKTNVIGAMNVIDAAIDCNIGRVMGISTDKGAAPSTIYGATKMVMEKLFVHASSYVSAKSTTRLSCVRYGNVIGSRGSVVPLFLKQKEGGTLTVTLPGATRFWLTLPQAVDFVLSSIERMEGGEIFVPKPPASSVAVVASAIAPGCSWELTGLSPGEKLDEILISRDENYDDLGDYFIVRASGKLRNNEFSSARTRQLDALQVRELVDSLR